MKRDSRLCSVLHILLHMADTSEPLSSERLAEFLKTNPVVVRRTMAGLRDAGLVTSDRGHGGGWRLARALAEIRLLDVYTALGDPPFFAMGNRSEKPECLAEQAVNAALDEAFETAKVILIGKMRSVTLADIAKDFERRAGEHRQHPWVHHAV